METICTTKKDFLDKAWGNDSVLISGNLLEEMRDDLISNELSLVFNRLKELGISNDRVLTLLSKELSKHMGKYLELIATDILP